MHRNRSESSVLLCLLQVQAPCERERLIGARLFPKTQQQDGEFSRHRHRGPLLCPRCSIGRQHQAISAQSALRTERTEDVLRGANEQSAQVGVATFGDAQWRIALPTLIAFWT